MEGLRMEDGWAVGGGDWGDNVGGLEVVLVQGFVRVPVYRRLRMQLG